MRVRNTKKKSASLRGASVSEAFAYLMVSSFYFSFLGGVGHVPRTILLRNNGRSRAAVEIPHSAFQNILHLSQKLLSLKFMAQKLLFL